MAPDKRLPIGFKVKIPNVEELQKLSGRMSTLAEGNFRYHNGRLLDLLQVRVNENALTTLAQFYDPPLRCFTFQDFQLAPTFEEFAKILGFDLWESKPYLNLEEEPTMDDLAKALDLGVEEVTSWLVKTKDNGMVIPRKVLEAKVSDLLAKKEWGSFNAILSLLVYGLMLFPKVNDSIDMPAIGVFLVGSPVHALLADFHLSLCSRHEKRRGGTIVCCTPLMQLWLYSHLPKKGFFVENQEQFLWPNRMVALTEKDIAWYSREYDGTKIIL
ncbi:uncharacterized protein LOC123896046 [Trifolium pratense]|uniref:uncharacterized protein LOC123896046 n=1 Tax=Trifolium pratense TaxID=57577 RepID=UPI001E69603E|nr:uncharacterized protein LOC123896046 [Trifolium pratense]